MKLLLPDGSNYQKNCANQGEDGFDLAHPKTNRFMECCEGKRNSLPNRIVELRLPVGFMALSPLKTPSDRLAQAPRANDITGKSQHYHEQRPFGQIAIENATNRPEYDPVRANQRIAHLQTGLGEFSGPILKLAAHFLKGLLLRLMNPYLLEFQ